MTLVPVTVGMTQLTQSVKVISIQRFKVLYMNCICKIPASLPEFQRNPWVISSAAALISLGFLPDFSGTSGVLGATFF